MAKKFKKNKQRRIASLVNLLLASQKELKIIERLQIVKHSFSITETDRITRIYKKNHLDEIREVTCVSYEVLIKNDWNTVVYFDNFHGGILHKHLSLGMDNESDFTTQKGVKRNGTSKQLLTWCMNHLTTHYLEYRTYFRRKNRQILSKYCQN